MKSTFENNILTIYPEGTLDTNNADQFGEEVAKIREAYPEGQLVLDLDDLTYISSAGLRQILKLKKREADFKIINCSSEIYDIFEMTGFAEMMDISKAYRELSVDGCEVIGEGANGKVYRIDADTIVKVYKNRDALEEIHNERELARKAFVMGVPTAIPYDVVKVGDLYGSVFELLNARSLSKTMLKPGELPDKKQEALVWANYCKDYLPEEIGNKLVALVEAIPDTFNMLHGDYHIKNIMQQNGENLLIDMDTLAMGHPIFEFAAIYAAYVGFSCIDRENVFHFLGIPYEQAQVFWKATLRNYFETDDEAVLQKIEDQAAVICYARLLRRTFRKAKEDDAYKAKLVEYCKNALCTLVPRIDTLSF